MQSNDQFCREENLCAAFKFNNLGFLERIVSAEVGNNALEHTFDVLNRKILVTKFDFVF